MSAGARFTAEAIGKAADRYRDRAKGNGAGPETAGHGAGSIWWVRCDGKRPIDAKWQKTPPTDAEAEAHFAAGGNLGLIPGKCSPRWAVLDVDEGDPAALMAAHPPAFSVSTPRGGRHLYYSHPGGEIEIGNGRWSLHGCSGDIRADSGYVVAWDRDAVLEALDMGRSAPFPVEALPKREKARPRAKRTRRKAAGKRPPPPPGAGRSDRKWDEADVRAMLEAMDADACYHDWIKIGMALHDGGFPLSLWQEWSRQFPKYEPGDCAKRWKGFTKGGGVAMATLAHLATEAGWSPSTGGEAPEPIPDATDLATGRKAFMAHYRRVRGGAMTYLRRAWEFARWFDPFAKEHFSRGGKQSATRCTLLAFVADLRENHGLRWSYSTVQSYRRLADYEWTEIRKQGGLSAALEWCRDQTRTDKERAELKERREMSKHRDRVHRREIANRDDRIDALETEIEKLRIVADTAKLDEFRTAVRTGTEKLAARDAEIARLRTELAHFASKFDQVAQENAHLRRIIERLTGKPPEPRRTRWQQYEAEFDARNGNGKPSQLSGATL